MGPRELDSFVCLDGASEAILARAVQQLQLSARAYHRILKLARTIADLEQAENVQANHLAEALQYRPRLRRHDSPDCSWRIRSDQLNCYRFRLGPTGSGDDRFARFQSVGNCDEPEHAARAVRKCPSPQEGDLAVAA